MRVSSWRAVAAVSVGVATVMPIACSAPPGGGPAAVVPATLHEVTLPDLSRMDPPVQQQAKNTFAVVGQKRDAKASNAELGTAYGDYAMLLHAGEYYDAAEPAYLNAQALMPEEPRWPYYLGHLHKSEGDVGGAVNAFRRSLALRPNEVGTLIWLGRLLLDQGQPAEAGPLFERARSAQPNSVAVLVGLGQVALANKDFSRAVELLNAALESDPSIASIHSPLAMAYRGLGKTEDAAAHLKQWRNTEVPIQDPWKRALDMTLESGLSYELRGIAALDARDFPAAVKLFRQGVALTEGGTVLGRSLRHKLGTALFLTGDVPSGLKALEEVVQLAPAEGLDEPTAKANYSLGVVSALNGNVNEGLARLRAAVAYSPNYLEARLLIAQVLRANGRFAQALPEYEEVVRIAPRNADARFGYAMALVRLRRYQEARAWLEEATRVLPDRLELTHALARILAAGPGDRVRDGARALALTERLTGTMGKTADLGETLAMALAELGRFEEAVDVQRALLGAAQQAGQADAARRIRGNLALYERRQPCRLPWPDDHPVHSVSPADAAQAAPSR